MDNLNLINNLQEIDNIKIIDKKITAPIVNNAFQDIINIETNELFQNFILPWREKIGIFLQNFKQISLKYAQSNNFLSLMQQSLDPQLSDRGKTITLSAKEYQKNTLYLEEFKEIFKQGHFLLLQFRRELTGQNIQTKFIIEINNQTYQVDELDLIEKVNFVLSQYGGKTISNPFSLAYQIDNNIELVLQDLVQQGKAEIISESDVWKKIWDLKAPYLAKKSIKTKREYKNIFYDSKDAEIYTLYSGNPPGGGLNLKYLTLKRYSDLRQSLGGNGGYASPFFKTGDIGSVQVKFFKIKNDRRISTVNFARFSLIRDRLQELFDILNLNSQQEIGEKLLKFFTEKKENLTNQVTISTNAAAKQAIKELFNL